MSGGKTMLSRMAAAVATALVAVPSAIRVAFAAGTDPSLPPEYSEILRLAGEKVRAATQPGAIGNGVPIMNIDLGAMLPWMGVGIAAAVGAIVAAKCLAPRVRSKMIIAH
jgi:hypothetical protein